MNRPNRPNRPGRLAVGLVGAGRVGAVLGSALRAAGHEIIGVWAATESARERADALLPGVPVGDLAEVARQSDLVVVSVAEDDLPGTVALLAREGALHPGQILVHTARTGLDVLAPATALGVAGLAIRPTMTFTGTSLDLARLEGTAFLVTAPPAVLPVGQALVVEMGGEPVIVPDAARAACDAALTMVTEHLGALVLLARSVAARAGVTATGEDVDGPSRLVAHAARSALEAALTMRELDGPASRADLPALASHLAALDAFDRLDALEAPDGPQARDTATSGADPAFPDPVRVGSVYRALAGAAARLTRSDSPPAHGGEPTAAASDGVVLRLLGIE